MKRTPIADSIEPTPPARISALHAIRDATVGETSKTQCARLLGAIQALQHCTTFEASRYLDIYDPRARKLQLVKDGYPVTMTWRNVLTEAGERHRVGVYSLAPTFAGKE